jgi:hypothetical protein
LDLVEDREEQAVQGREPEVALRLEAREANDEEVGGCLDGVVEQVFPMPGSPLRTSVPLSPPRTEARSESSALHSCTRPRSVTTREPRATVAA